MERQGAEAAGEFFVPDLCGPRQVFVLVLLAELLVLAHVLASGRLGAFDWSLLALSSLFVQWVVLLSAGLLCLMRSRLARLGLVAASASALVLVMSVTALVSIARGWLLPAAGSAVGPGDVLRDVLVALVIAGIALRYFYLQRQLRLREQSELRARVEALRARIRPHFLFNTLNSIASLIEARPQQAEAAVEDLAALFRASLREDGEPTTLEDEIGLCQRYLGIEALRLGERLKVSWQVPPPLRDAVMPAFVLQPLLENAVYHGISRLPEGGEIEVTAREGDGLLYVEVRNPMPVGDTRSAGLHMALENIAQRLSALYGERAGLEREGSAAEFRVRLVYPLEKLP